MFIPSTATEDVNWDWIGRSKFSTAVSILDRAIQNHDFPGCAFGVLEDNQATLLGALGNFTYDNSSAPVNPETVFDIASLTKVVATTSAAMLLIQRGLLDLETPLGDLLPGFVVGRDTSEHAHRVTIRHLLAHSAGLPGYLPLYRTAVSPSDLIRKCLRLPLEAQPGTRAEYSDPGFILLGKAIEEAIDESLDSFVNREISSPLGLIHTVFCPPESVRLHIPPTEIDENFRHRKIQGEVQDEHAYILKGVAGHAGLFSNVADLLRFAEAILSPAPDSLFKPEIVESFVQKQGPAGSSRALGWDTPSEPSSSGTLFSATSIGHLGYSGCSLWIDREAKIAVALLTNRTWPNRGAQGIRSVRPLFHDAIRKSI